MILKRTRLVCARLDVCLPVPRVWRGVDDGRRRSSSVEPNLGGAHTSSWTLAGLAKQSKIRAVGSDEFVQGRLVRVRSGWILSAVVA